MENQNYKGSNPNSPTTEDVGSVAIDEMDEEAAVKEHLTSDDPTKVKFVSANAEYMKKNGEAKVDIENVQRSVGMGKEELLKYANDPFWVRLRMTLFVLFWFVWVAMLVGSVVIIILAPRCPPPPQLDWWQKSVVYQVLVGSYKDSNADGHGDLQGLTSKLNYLEENKLNTLLLGPIFRSKEPDYGLYITNFNEIDPVLGTMEDFNDLVAEMETKDMKLLLELVPNHSSNEHPWFEKSAKREAPYTDYYIWANGKHGSDKDPPNNWLSAHGGSAWTWHKERKQFYLHQNFLEQPDLNLRNPAVKEEIKNIMLFWLDKGVDGFKIDNFAQLLEDEDLKDEVGRNASIDAKEYDQLEHSNTLNHPMTIELLREWREIIDGYTGQNDTTSHKRILLTDIPSEYDSFNTQYYGNSTFPLSDIPFNNRLLEIPNEGQAIFLREAINSSLNAVPDGLWPNWVLGTTDHKRLASRVGSAIMDGIHAITLLAKGTPIIYYGDEIGMENVTIPDHMVSDPVAIRNDAESRDPMKSPMQWDNTSSAGFTSGKTTFLPVAKNYASVNVLIENTAAHSHLKIFQTLMAIRENPSIRFGTMHYHATANNVFSMARIRKGNPGYLAIVNFSNNDTTIDLTATNDKLPDSGKIELATPSVSSNALSDTGHPIIQFASVRIASKQTLVLSFVPKSD